MPIRLQEGFTGRAFISGMLQAGRDCFALVMIWSTADHLQYLMPPRPRNPARPPPPHTEQPTSLSPHPAARRAVLNTLTLLYPSHHAACPL
jgi:hypothetical protein